MATTNHATGELITIPARGGKAVSIRQGQAVKVINTHGSQVVDTWAFNSQDLTEFMSMPFPSCGGHGHPNWYPWRYSGIVLLQYRNGRLQRYPTQSLEFQSDGRASGR